MDIENMEQLAREYRLALAGGEQNDAVELVEMQTVLLERMRAMRPQSKTIPYLLQQKRASFLLLQKEGASVAATGRVVLPQNANVRTLVQWQMDLLLQLDRLPVGENTNKLLQNEMRFLGFLPFLNV